METIIDTIIGWCIRENKDPQTASLMITEYNKDAEFWFKHDLWDLFDTITAI